MPRSTNPFAYTNWQSAPILNEFLTDVKAHTDDAMHGNPANKVVINPAVEELAESCIQTLKALGMQDIDILRVINEVYDNRTVTA